MQNERSVAAGDGSVEAGTQNAAAAPSSLIEDIQQLDAERVGAWLVTWGLPALQALVVLILALLLSAWVKRAIARGLEKAKVDVTLARFLGNLAKWLILVVAGVLILGEFGVETAGLAAMLAAAGFAIGLAMQGTLGHLAAGVMLLVFRPYRIGDVVNVSGVLGKVHEVELFYTTVDTFDNRRFIVPNGSIFGSTIENISHHGLRRVDVNVGVEYPADIDRTREVLEGAVASLGDVVLKEPAHQVFLGDLGDSSVNWTVRVWVDSAGFWDVKQALTRAVKMHLDEAGLGIPFPQMDVHLYKADGGG